MFYSDSNSKIELPYFYLLTPQIESIEPIFVNNLKQNKNRRKKYLERIVQHLRQILLNEYLLIISKKIKTEENKDLVTIVELSFSLCFINESTILVYRFQSLKRIFMEYSIAYQLSLW